jgi:hypothetical protein
LGCDVYGRRSTAVRTRNSAMSHGDCAPPGPKFQENLEFATPVMVDALHPRSRPSCRPQRLVGERDCQLRDHR